MTFTFKPIDEASVRAFVYWRYEPPYQVYNLNPPDELDSEYLQYFLDPENAYHSITDETGELLAFCSFGPDGQVPGGDYSAGALDIGLGVRPDLTGQGRGASFVAATIDFARRAFRPPLLRVTIAEFNKRARQVWEQAGFRQVQRFRRERDGAVFVILVRKAATDGP